MKQLSLDIHAESATRVLTTIGNSRYFVDANVPLTPKAESGMSTAFFPAMENSLNVTAHFQADKTFYDNIDKLAEIAGKWWGWKARNPFSIESHSVTQEPQPQAALFFTGGVDSFCSLLRHPGEIKGLIHVHGFDIPLTDAQRYVKAKDWIEAVAKACDIEPIYIATDLRENPVFNDVSWEITHVAALACIAHLLTEKFGHVFLASSDVPPPWGSNEKIDPLWSSSTVKIINDGWHLTRLEKVKFISGSSLVHRYLKVCWENGSSNLNCGYCEKCVRTQAQFAVAGAFECLETFPPGRLKEKIDGIAHVHGPLIKQWIDIRNQTKDSPLRRSINRLLTHSQVYALKDKLPPGMKRFLKSHLSFLRRKHP